MKRTFVGALPLAALVVTVWAKAADCQEQMIINGLATPEDVYTSVQVKVAAWLWSDSSTTVTLRVAYHKDDTTRAAVIDVSHNGSWAKVHSDWVDLFQTVPEASTEAIGMLFLQARVDGDGFNALVGGSSIILRCLR